MAVRRSCLSIISGPRRARPSRPERDETSGPGPRIPALLRGAGEVEVEPALLVGRRPEAAAVGHGQAAVPRPDRRGHRLRGAPGDEALAAAGGGEGGGLHPHHGEGVVAVDLHVEREVARDVPLPALVVVGQDPDERGHAEVDPHGSDRLLRAVGVAHVDEQVAVVVEAVVAGLTGRGDLAGGLVVAAGFAVRADSAGAAAAVVTADQSVALGFAGGGALGLVVGAALAVRAVSTGATAAVGAADQSVALRFAGGKAGFVVGARLVVAVHQPVEVVVHVVDAVDLLDGRAVAGGVGVEALGPEQVGGLGVLVVAAEEAVAADHAAGQLALVGRHGER